MTLVSPPSETRLPGLPYEAIDQSWAAELPTSTSYPIFVHVLVFTGCLLTI